MCCTVTRISSTHLPAHYIATCNYNHETISCENIEITTKHENNAKFLLYENLHPIKLLPSTPTLTLLTKILLHNLSRNNCHSSGRLRCAISITHTNCTLLATMETKYAELATIACKSAMIVKRIIHKYMAGFHKQQSLIPQYEIISMYANEQVC